MDTLDIKELEDLAQDNHVDLQEEQKKKKPAQDGTQKQENGVGKDHFPEEITQSQTTIQSSTSTLNRDVNTPSTTQGDQKVNKDLFYTKPTEDDDENEVEEFCPDQAVNVAQPGEFM